MKFTPKIARWMRILGIILVVIGLALMFQAFQADASIPLNAWIALAVGIVGVVLSRRKEGEGDEA